MEVSEGRDPFEQRLSREQLFRVAAAAGGAGLLAGRADVARAARAQLAKESGRLKVLDWAGYENDGGQPKSNSWGLLFDERYKGKIAWFDDITMLEIAGLYLGVKNTWQQTDAELKRSKDLLISKKKLVRLTWSSETNLWEAFGSGDIWIAYAWPNDWVQMKKKKLPVVYMRPKEKPLAWVGMFMLLKGTPRFRLAHAYVDAWSSKKSAKWLEDNYGYGHANTLARPASSDLLHALRLTNPRAVTLPNAYLDRDIPRRALYARMWEEVKAA